LAHELGPRQITVNAVLPGAVNTDAIREQPGDIDTFIAGEIAQTPLRRIGQPDDIADVVAFLVSDGARWVTGQSIGAGGGMF
jgi:3-oxoacyl-[acyl-carrier protein] reductase